MENASKALLMAGGVMLTMLVVSILMYGWGTFSEYQAELDRIKEVENVAKFNQQFTNYERNDVQGFELLSLVNKVIDYNQRHSEDGTTTGSAAGNDASYKGITINIQMYENDSSSVPDHEDNVITKADVIDRLTRKIELPVLITGGTAETIENNPSLFNEKNYTQSKTTNRFKSEILDVVKPMELSDSEYGGAVGIQNLVKNIDTIYQGKVINYNKPILPSEPDKTWYDKLYIESRYKTLTGKQYTIDEIRKKNKMEDVLKYYEYSNFKKAIFECTGVNYDINTGRVIGMDFRFTDEIM